MDAEEGKLHIVMWPWLAFGHMLPYLELAKCLAQKGHRVSFFSTPRNIDRLPTIPHNLRSRLNLVKLIPPPIEGLPEDCQSTMDVPFDQIPLIQRLQDGLEGQVCAFIEENKPFPDWIVYDIGVYLAPRVATKYGIPSLFFGPLSAMTFSFIGPPSVHLSTGSGQTLSLQLLTRPPPWIPFPTTISYRFHEAQQILKISSFSSSSSGVPENYRLGMTFQGCQAAAVRSCTEFEPEWIQLLGKLYQKPVFPIGMLPPPVSTTDDEVDEAWASQQEWLETVHEKQGRGVVYVAFGSEFRLSREQVHELAFGLELSDIPFFWAYRGDPALLPPGLEERTKGRGRVALGWVPQPRILAHPSVGGFLTHCGWSSSVEALVFGKPVIMLPMFADQGLITRVMVLKKVGVEVPRNDEDGSFTRDAVAKCLKLVMVDDDEGESIRSNAREMSKIYGDQELNGRYIEDFTNYLVEHRREEKLS